VHREVAEPTGAGRDLEGRSLRDDNRPGRAEGMRLSLDAHLSRALDPDEEDVPLVVGLLGGRLLGPPGQQGGR
jgi:hypothetical protein